MKAIIAIVVHTPGHWIFIGIAFVKITRSADDTHDIWEYDFKLGDTLKGTNRKKQIAVVKKFIRYAVSELFYNGDAAYKSAVNPRIVFTDTIANVHGDFQSPAQRDNSSCGVGALMNSLFFMKEKRLSNTNDYTPDINGIIGLKCFILAKLIEQNDLQLYPGLFAHAEAADEEQGYAAQFEVLMNGEGQNVVHILDPEADRQELEDLKKALLLSKHELNRLEAKESGSVKACVIDLL